MINSLFESFDPFMSLLGSSLTIFFLPIISPVFLTFWLISTRQNMTIENVNNLIFSELSASLNNPNNKFNVLWLISIFVLILTFNLTGLIPYVYTVTSQILFTLSLALPLWLGFAIFSFFFNTSQFLSHLVPLSTPLPLSQFITIIETTSQLIRPITLSVRLCANMTAGHILIALASGPIFIFNIFSLVLIILLVLETAVAFIQSYVFTILLSMYLNETY